MALYDEDMEREKPGKQAKSETVALPPPNTVWEESERGVYIPESVLYLVGEIAEYTLLPGYQGQSILLILHAPFS